MDPPVSPNTVLAYLPNDGVHNNKDNQAEGQIFNIGNPANNYSIKEMAQIVVDEMKKFPCFREKAEKVEFVI